MSAGLSATNGAVPSTAAGSATAYVKAHHRKTSSLWVPPSRPAFSNPAPLIRQKAESSGRTIKSLLPCGACCLGAIPSGSSPEYRIVMPNHRFDAATPRYEHPNRVNYADNRISTTKYSLLTFIPKNLFEQFHRFANLYFIFVVVLNIVIEAFGRFISMIPIIFVLLVTAVKDAFEDYRRYRSDVKINHLTCRVWDNERGRYRKMEWRHILVGDFVHLSCNEIIPADILFLRSSDENGICYVETSNLDGENSLKQRQIVTSMGSASKDFVPPHFKAIVFCEQPNNHIYRFNGYVEHENGEKEAVGKMNLLLRGCEVRNTDFVEGIVLYAGRDTKAMLNNSGPRYKRSGLEKLTNFDILWCVVLLILMCVAGAVFSTVWLSSFSDHYSVPFLNFDRHLNQLDISEESFTNFWRYIIVLQVMIPISLYVSTEIIKLGQSFLTSQDLQLYYEPADKRIQCRALNIPEELGQIQYVMSDKTGTLTENQMMFRRCFVGGRDYGTSSETDFDAEAGRRTRAMLNFDLDKDLLENVRFAGTRLLLDGDDALQLSSRASADLIHLFINMAICNTVVVNAQPHQDHLDEAGFVVGDSFIAGNSAFHLHSNGFSLKEKNYSSNPDGEEPVKASSESHTESQSEHAETSDAEESRAVSSASLDELACCSTAVPSPSCETIGDDSTLRCESKKSEEDDVREKDSKGSANGVDSPRGSSRILSLNFGRLHVKAFKLSPLLRFKKASGNEEHFLEGQVVPNPIYEAESPDELALVQAASEYGVSLCSRQLRSVLLQVGTHGSVLKYTVLHVLAFDSDRKRMSVVVRDRDGRIVVYCKGADSAVLPIISESFKASEYGCKLVGKVEEHISLYASYGLRTLCFCKRLLTDDKYALWKMDYEKAEVQLNEREQKLRECAIQLEVEMELLGVTAIEDRLQKGVPECIEALRQAGIGVWVLTGDKIETAVNIAYASKLFSQSMELVQLSARNEADTGEMLDLIAERLAKGVPLEERASSLSRRVVGSSPDECNGALLSSPIKDDRREYGVVVSGQTLTCCLLPSNLPKFLEIVERSSAVLCCRATPLQKASMVKLVKRDLEGKVLAIGDGANDVSMIQCADVGVGISGQEGMQAVMASDFALARFRFLQRLLLVHGHWCYHRLATIILYFLYKNALFVFVLFWCQIFNGFSAQVPVDPIYLMVYNLFFTSVPPLLFGITEQDAPAELLLRFPSLYSQGRRSKLYRWYSFWLNMLDALWQSLAVYFTAHMVYWDTDCDVWKFGFVLCTQLLCVNTAHFSLFVNYWTPVLLLVLILSIVFFFVFAFVYNAIVTPSFNVKDTPVNVSIFAVGDPCFWLTLGLSTAVAVFPRFVVTVMVNTVKPNDVFRHKLAQRIAEEKKRKSFDSFRLRWSHLVHSTVPESGDGGISGATRRTTLSTS